MSAFTYDYSSAFNSALAGRPKLEQPEDCLGCIHQNHPENCRKHCPTLARNRGMATKQQKDLGGIPNA